MIYHRLIRVRSHGDYDSVVLIDSPLGYWKCDEVSGTTLADSSGNGRHGLISSDADVVHGAEALRPGSSGSLSTTALVNSAAGIDTTGFNPITTNNWSMECIAQITSVGTVCGQVLSADDGTFSDEGSPSIRIRSGVWQANPDEDETEVLTSSFDGTSPAHAVFTRDTSIFSLYLNGSLVLSKETTFTNPTSNILNLLGSDGFSSSYGVIGRISDVALYDYTLSQLRILAHAQSSGYA